MKGMGLMEKKTYTAEFKVKAVLEGIVNLLRDYNFW